MGSVGVEEEDAGVKEFLQRCEPSGDAAYGELKALLGRLHDPATRREARVFLTDLRRRQEHEQQQEDDHESFFRRFGFRIQELCLHNTTTAASAVFLSSSAAGRHIDRIVN